MRQAFLTAALLVAAGVPLSCGSESKPESASPTGGAPAEAPERAAPVPAVAPAAITLSVSGMT